MTEPKIFFHSNIKFLRERRKLVQSDMVERLGIARNKLQPLEDGKTKNPSAVDLIKFSEFFGISIDALMKVDLRKIGEQKLRELLAGNDVYLTGSNIRILAISVDKDNKENVEYVPVKAKAGYRSGYNDPQFIASLPKYSIPNLPKGKTYRVFPTSGDSMLPIPEDADIIGEHVQDWKGLKPDTACVVILKGEGADFVFKLVTIKEDEVLLKSLNELYNPYTVPINEVLEIWKFYAYTSNRLPQPESFTYIASQLREISTDIKQLKGQRRI